MRREIKKGEMSLQRRRQYKERQKEKKFQRRRLHKDRQREDESFTVEAETIHERQRGNKK